jgi:hypothetical protein
MDYMTRTKPKGYNKKVWEYCWNNAETNKQWAIDTVTNNSEWCKMASKNSLEMLGRYLADSIPTMAKAEYDYLEMRACGQTCIGALDPSAREKYEGIIGHKITPSRMWKYDHTKHITYATKKGKVWTHNGVPC